MYYDDHYSEGGRLSFSSVVLLVIFVSAFALIVAAIIWRPWSDDDAEPALAPVAVEQAAPDAIGDAAAVDAGAVAPEAAPAEAVSGP